MSEPETTEPELGEIARQRAKKKQQEEWLIQKKKQFADELAKDPLNPSDCSYRVFPEPENMRFKVTATVSWINDPIVKARLLEITGSDKVDDGKEISVEAQCNRYLKIYEQSENPKDQVLALSQIDKIKGFDKSAGNNVTINNQKVIVIPRALSNDEWEANAKRQQENLANGIVDVRAIEVKQE
jgi:hypothetical protein